MRERGIIMAADSVRAILAGRKTQTRRVVKPQPGDVLPPIRVDEYEPVRVDRNGEEYAGEPIFGAYSADGEWGIRCPYGAPGDRLWVKEAFAVVRLFPGGHGDYGEQRVTGPLGGDRDDYRLIYAADEREDGPWRSPLFMPRWASRLTLEVVEVRVERLHAIQEDDARAEGVIWPAWEDFEPVTFRFKDGALDPHGDTTLTGGPARCAFEHAWDAINARRGFPWASNPWVWAVTFKRVEAV